MNNLRLKYRLIETKLTDEDLGVYRTFGMEAVCGEEVLRRQEDISLNKNTVEALIEKCNRGQLAIIHFNDVVEDLLAAC